ncbi:MAG: IS701 family transposase [Acidobacteria bacterium]|nr:MAG: IS701 family transposase [Acidobacteriota bacterium]
MARRAGQLISRGPHTWLVRVSLGREPETGTRKYRNKTIRGSFREAQTYLNAKLQEHEIGRLPRAAAISLNQYLNQWLTTAARPRLRPKSYSDYEGLLRLYIRPCLGTRPIGAITQFDILNVYARMTERGLLPRTIEYTNAVLQSAFRQAVRWKMLAEDPCVGVDLPPLQRREMEALSVEECRRFLTVAMESKRKSIIPMAERLGVDSQSLQQFVTDSPWSQEAMWTAIRQEVIPHLEPLEAWVVDETGWVKQGTHSVGVSHQYCGAVGKQANCQVSVEVVVSDRWIAAPVGGRPYLPASWTKDRERCTDVGVPEEVSFATKPELAPQILRQARRDGVPAAPVLGDSAYGINTEFRAGVRQLQMEFFLQVDGSELQGWDHEVRAEVKRVRRYVREGEPPAQTLAELSSGIPQAEWKNCSWVTVGGKTRHTSLAWREVFLQHDLRHARGELEKVWLVVDWPASDPEPYHYYSAHLHRPPTKARCLKLSRSRRPIEQYFQRSKDDLGLDHFEGRPWRGFHHHLALSAVAYLFVLTVYLRRKKNFWCDVGTDSPRDPALGGEVERLLSLLRH